MSIFAKMITTLEPRIITPPQAKGLLKKIKPQPAVASGLHQESAIGLYLVKYGSTPQASVFLYPAKYTLTPKIIMDFDGRFTEVNEPAVNREFKDTSIETLDKLFLQSAKSAGLISFMDYEHKLYREKVLEHAFDRRTDMFLADIIQELKP